MFTRAEELSDYNRHWLPPKVSRANKFSSTWTFTSDVKAPYPRVRFRIVRNEGDTPVVFGDWITPTTRQVVFQNITADDGYYLELPEVENNADVVIPQPRIVNASGKALPERKPWTSADRFDIVPPHNLTGHGLDSRLYAQITVGTTIQPAPTYPLKPREFRPIVNPANSAQMWVRRVGIHQFAKHPDVFEVPTPGAAVGQGDVCVSRGMNYFYAEGTAYDGRPNGLQPPIPPCRDGPRGYCTVPYVGKARNRMGGPGTFVASTVGYFAFLNGEYSRNTLAGWRLKAGMIQPHPAYRSTDPVWYAAHFDFVGDTSLMGAGWKPGEIWGFATAERFDPGNTHDFWLCVTMTDEIAGANHWTAHPPATYKPTPYPAPNYTPPAAPTGQLTWVPFIRDHPLCKQPWGIEAHPTEPKFWYTNFDSFGAAGPVYGGGFIARCNRTAATVDGLEIEAVHKPPAVNDWEIGVPTRLFDANLLGPFSTMIAGNDVPDVLCGRWFGKVPTDFSAVEAGDLTVNGVPLPAIPAATTATQRVAQIGVAFGAAPTCGVKAWATPAGAYSPLKGGMTLERIGYTAPRMTITVKDAATTARTGIEAVDRRIFLVDGPVDPDGTGNGASCIHPQDCGFFSDGTFLFAERYTYTLRTIKDGQVATFAKLRPVAFAGTSSGDNDIGFSIDDQDRVLTTIWQHKFVHDRKGTYLGTYGQSSANGMPPGIASQCSPTDYDWAIAANGNRIISIGNAGHSFEELSQRLPTDVVPDQGIRARGYAAFMWSGTKSMAITHGTYLENTMGGPNLESLGACSDDALKAYFSALGIPETVTVIVDGKPQEQHPVADVIGQTRSRTVDYAYPTPLLDTVPGFSVPTPPDDGGGDHGHEPPEDPAVIAQLQQQVAALQDQITALQTQIATATASNTQMQQSVTDLTTQLQAAQAKLDAAQATQDHADALQKKVDGFVGSMADLVAAASNG